VSSAKILVTDDEEMIRWSVAQTLRAAGYEVAEAGDAIEGMALFRQLLPDIVFLDMRLPDGNGLDLLKQIKAESGGESAVIMMTAYGEVRTAVEAMRLGAFDYLKKPFDFDELEVLVGKALEAIHLRREVVELRHERRERYGITNIIAHSEKMRSVLALVEKVAQSDTATVLLQGENGTGKDMLARAIHSHGKRSDAAFMDISCSAMPEALLESELFGYEKGAFTDARGTKRGLLELADGGTLFLDEIGDMPLLSQAKLLKFIETRTFKRLGGTADQRVDLRIIAATNCDLEGAVNEGRFRQDLYYRLKVIPVVLPPLRERRPDIPALVQHFMDRYNTEFNKHFARIDEDAMEVLLTYPWPGNVRELRNLIERILILERGDTIRLEHLPPEFLITSTEPRAAVHEPAAPTDGDFRLPDGGISLEEVEKDFVRQAIARSEGNQTRAAQLLGISRDALRYRLQKFGLG